MKETKLTATRLTALEALQVALLEYYGEKHHLFQLNFGRLKSRRPLTGHTLSVQGYAYCHSDWHRRVEAEILIDRTSRCGMNGRLVSQPIATSVTLKYRGQEVGTVYTAAALMS